MAAMGRKAKLTKENYLEAVRKTKSINDTDIATYLGMDRSTIYRFRMNEKNREIIIEARNILISITNIKFEDKHLGRDVFKSIPIVEEWIEIMTRNEVSKKVIGKRVSALYKVCCRLRTHPEMLNVEIVAKLVVEMRELRKDGKKAPSGLAYYTIRKPLRSFYQLMKGISGERLAIMGIDASKSEGSGLQAKEKISIEQRKRFVKNLRDVVKELAGTDYEVDYLSGGRKFIVLPKDISPELMFLEIVNIDYFMYYTGSRITSTLKITLSDSLNKNNKKVWSIHILDKGEKGGKHWQKTLVGDALDKMKNYVSKRFKIPIDELEETLPKMTGYYLFPLWSRRYRDVISINKEALRRSGVVTAIPNHIFRHTFAQDGLDATDHNYELIASIGGWESTTTMKEHYGEMSDEARNRGLIRAMGEPVEDVTYELRWDGAIKREKMFKCPQCKTQFSLLTGICPNCKYSNLNPTDWLNPDYVLKGDNQ